MLQFACPRCKTILSVPQEQGGSQVACPTCKQPLIIPKAAPPPAPPASASLPPPPPAPNTPPKYSITCPHCGQKHSMKQKPARTKILSCLKCHENMLRRPKVAVAKALPDEPIEVEEAESPSSG